MPRLPDVTSLGERRVPVSQRNVPTDRSGEITGAAVAGFGDTLARVGADIQERQDRFAYAQARSELLQADIAIRRELENDQDFGTYEQRYREKLGKAREGATAKIQGRIDRAIFEQETKLDIERGVTSVREAARRKEVDVNRAGLNSLLESNRSAALEAKDEAQRVALIRNAQDAITGARNKGYINAQEAVEQSQAFGVSYAEGWLSLQSPSKQIELLVKPAGTVVEKLPADRRAHLLEGAQRRRLAEVELEYRLSERAEREINDATSKAGDSLLASGQLSTDWIEKNRARLSPSDFRYFYKALTDGDNADSDPMLYAGLRERAGLGEDVRAEARVALANRRIGRDDYDRLLSEVESERPGWYKRGTQYISTSAAVSDLNPDPAAAQRKAAMLDDWNEWATTNPKATDAQAQTEYRRLVSEYAIVNYDRMTLMKRSPRFLVGTRNAPNIEATEQATVDAFRSGQIDRAEFERQAALLAEWREAYQSTQKKP